MPDEQRPGDWTVVIPIRDPRTGKSRLRAGAAVNAAIARDTLAAARACGAVGRVLLVTDETDWLGPELLASSKVHVVQQHSTGLADAIELGLERAGRGRVAVMLGDLPSLAATELEAALRAADDVPLGMVTDHCETGTTLITAPDAADHRPSFGPGSAALHRGLGYEELPVPTGSGLRRDVDTPEDLDRALRRGIGAATKRAVERSEALAS
ncbi:2-phospho-L-lactate guanylyltransferase [Leucobacter sp. gxy201]|uniref:2-phospho-L-lactate guanylyltransferase n=1 Tax=Leucobacter sp. gxy201 TaxID=2957200 RepID=UPI003DA037DD